MRCVVSCGSTSFPWLVLFFGAKLWESMIYKVRLQTSKVVKSVFVHPFLSLFPPSPFLYFSFTPFLPPQHTRTHTHTHFLWCLILHFSWKDRFTAISVIVRKKRKEKKHRQSNAWYFGHRLLKDKEKLKHDSRMEIAALQEKNHTAEAQLAEATCRTDTLCQQLQDDQQEMTECVLLTCTASSGSFLCVRMCISIYALYCRKKSS